MVEPTFLGVTATVWIALGTVVMALAGAVSVLVSVLLMNSQQRVIDIQFRLVELQREANWLNGALASHSQVMVRLEAEKRGKKVVWWDPTHDGPIKKRPPHNAAHLGSAIPETIYAYVPVEERRYPKID